MKCTFFIFKFLLFICVSSTLRGSSTPNRVLFNHTITQVDTLGDASLLIGDAKGYLYTYDGKNKARISEDPIGYIHDFYPYQSGHLICSESGLYLFRQGKLRKLGQIDITAYRILLHQGHLYVLANEGIYELLGKQLVQLNERLDPYATRAYYDWVKIKKEVYLLGKNYLRNLTNAEDTLYRQEQPILSILYTNESLLLGDNTGLYTLQNGIKKQVLLGGKSISDAVDGLFASDSDQWFLSQKKKSLHWDNEAYLLNPISPPISIREQGIEDLQVDHWKNIWLAQGKILHCYQTANEKTLPVISLLSMAQNGEFLDFNHKPLRFRKEENQLSFRFSSVELSGKNIRSFYTLDRGKTWSETDGFVDIKNLAPGRYDFQIRSTVDDKYYSYSPVVSFSVAGDPFPFWYQALLALGAGALVLALFLLWRSKENQGKLSLEKEKLQAQNKALQKSQKVLQLQMNPHFVFNTINSINGLLSKNEVQKASRYLTEFSKLMRSTLFQSRKDWIKIEEEVAYLNYFLSLEKMSRNNAFNYVIHTEDNLYDEDLSTLPMIIQPFVENALVHGIGDMRSGGLIELRFELKEVSLHVQIKDNGKGYQAKASNNEHESIALEVVRERLSQLRNKDLGFEIKNRKEVDGQNGTQVDLYLPIK